jgi:hypothetical protein
MTYGRISLWLSVRLARRTVRYADTLFAHGVRPQA